MPEDSSLCSCGKQSITTDRIEPGGQGWGEVLLLLRQHRTQNIPPIRQQSAQRALLEC